ncbi:MAG TPA: hypothetical protein VFE24_17495 [Pirellulales bacterium]|jgi:hypothetical protein|nr:hypothetical protein [Pirellulales bacterium]
MDHAQPVLDASFEAASQSYLGRWQRLISTTNWEKGRIIAEWRAALQKGDAPPAEFSDEAWSQRVKNVSGQHVGRLRRVFERFGPSHDQFRGLYWSHFQAALDWDDAEMWLEGAVQSEWSVAEMRRQRWETLGANGERPRDDEGLHGELDEDAEAANDPPSSGLDRVSATAESESHSASSSARAADRTADTNAGDETDEEAGDGAAREAADGPSSRVMPVQPFAEMPSLPPDLSEAFDQFKLAILRHRLTNWQEVSAADVLASLEALKQFTLAPAE